MANTQMSGHGVPAGEVLAGKVAIVTGAAQGLGAGFALTLAKAGARVVVGDLSDVSVTCAAIADIGGESLGAWLDVTDPASVRGVVEAARARFGGVDILVNNAAISGQLQLTPLTELNSADWDRVMAVNVRGVFECIKAVAPLMQERGYGKIINLASGTAIKGSPGLAHYVASKGAVISLTRAAARELGAQGVRVNALAPGLTMSEAMIANQSWTREMVANNIASRALKREATPADLMGALLFLASPASDFITGQTLSADGGSVMN
ncbi:SDR family NAD(P)-dependent oxidoreductase [Bosea massiliensis]|jgi:NAD(P)-dependent dehydrogenase (short-subunit alcohol dehydrogenase family)|uniref:SDR family NAD(P)-dependent oxidoreductase n=1 Tax=Bosea massiliensis TaxID=151419 RepID=A0ABW0P7Q0_9HYPH